MVQCYTIFFSIQSIGTETGTGTETGDGNWDATSFHPTSRGRKLGTETGTQLVFTQLPGVWRPTFRAPAPCQLSFSIGVWLALRGRPSRRTVGTETGTQLV